MAKYSPETKGSASSGQKAAEWTRSICGVLGIEGNHRYLYAAAFFDLLARVAGRIVEDPPRRDFTVSTRARRRFATPEHIATDSRFEGLALEAAQMADGAEAYLAAHLRAFERLQGAQKAHRKVESELRSDEALRHAHSAGRALKRLAHPVTEIAKHVAAEPAKEQIDVGRGRPQITDISRETLAVLFLGGLRIRDLENVLQGINPGAAERADERLLAAAQSFQDFGAVMEGWTAPPPQEGELSL